VGYAREHFAIAIGLGIAALVRIATGSATVATITATGLVAQIVERDPSVSRELMVLATGSGSLILSHVNDAGFWLVKEYFGLTVVETFKSWTVMETILSVLGLVLVLILSLVMSPRFCCAPKPSVEQVLEPKAVSRPAENK
jgi:H+/gluconate symporter-like permease